MLQGINSDCISGNRTHARAIFRPAFLPTGLHDFPQFISEFLPKDTIKYAIDTMV